MPSRCTPPRRRAWAVLAAGLVAAPFARADPPVAAVHPVPDRYGNYLVTDNYRWMESDASPDLKAYTDAATAVANAALASIPARDKLRRDIDAFSAPATTVSAMTADGDTLFYLKRGPGDDVAKLVTRPAGGGAERLLIDPEALPDAKPHSEIDQISPSPDGSHVAYGLAASGPDSAVLHVMDIARGETMPDAIPGARYAAVAWRHDGNGFYYTRAPSDTPPGGKMQLSVYLHMLKTDPATDVQVLNGARLPFAVHGDNIIPRLVLPPSSDYALAVVSDGVSPNLAVFVTPAAQLDEIPAPWQPMASQDDGVVEVTPSLSIAFLLTSSHAPRMRVVTEDLADPGFDNARTVMPQSDGVITGIAANADALFVARRQGAGMRLLRLDYNNSVAEDVHLPWVGSIAPATSAPSGGAGGLVGDPRSAGVLFSLEGWTQPLRWLRYDPHLHKAMDLGVVPAYPRDLSGYDTLETTVKAHDGTAVPLSLIMRHGLALDHTHPALLDAYGSYGYAYDPRFLPAALAWADQGGVYAIAHVRGGGEFGEPWHDAGRFARKSNSIGDLLSCANWLTTAGYSDAAHTTATGTNAGALVITNAMVRVPGAFAAIALQSGLTNPLRADAYKDAAEAVAEFGAAHNPAQFQNLFAIDPYSQVKDGVPFPAVLLNTAAADSAIPSWQSAKLAARLQAATSSGRPILLHVAPDAPATQAARNEAAADRMSFLLWQVGAPEFQPGAVVPGEAKSAKKKKKKPKGTSPEHH